MEIPPTMPKLDKIRDTQKNTAEVRALEQKPARPAASYDAKLSLYNFKNEFCLVVQAIRVEKGNKLK